MATKPQPIKRADGTVAFRIQWYENGTRDGRTFDDLPSAELFKRLVEAAGRRGLDRYPGDEIMLRHRLLDQTARNASPADTDTSQPESVVTVLDALEMFIEYKKSDPTRPPTERTLRGYQSMVDNYFRDTDLAGMDVATVRAKPIRAWLKEQKERPQRRTGRTHYVGVSGQSINHVLSFLSGMFTWATLPGSDPNPEGITPLRTIATPMTEIRQFRLSEDRKKEKRVLEDVNTYIEFFRCAYELDRFWADMLLVSAMTGMRFGEVSALTVEQVSDFVRCIIEVNKRYSAGKLEEGTKGSGSEAAEYVLSREARLPECLSDLLREHAAGKAPTAHLLDGPEFARAKKPRMVRNRIMAIGPRWSSSADRDRWVALDEKLKAAGIYREMRHHHLRHSLTTYLRDCGVPETVVKGVVGHVVDRGITARYLHLTEESWKRVMAALDPIAEAIVDIRNATYATHGPKRKPGVPSPVGMPFSG